MKVTGIDPGPTPGVAVLFIEHGRLVDAGVLQCSASLLHDVIDPPRGLIAVERFVARGRANAAQRLTVAQVAELARAHRDVILRTASQVKPWATDARLEAAGLLAACKGMRHARDAARQALYAAVHDAGLPDPLSKEWRR